MRDDDDRKPDRQMLGRSASGRRCRAEHPRAVVAMIGMTSISQEEMQERQHWKPTTSVHMQLVTTAECDSWGPRSGGCQELTYAAGRVLS